MAVNADDIWRTYEDIKRKTDAIGVPVPGGVRYPATPGSTAPSSESAVWQELLDQMWARHTAQLQDDRRWSEEQAQKAMEFSERMRDTAMISQYRQIKELGLNPAMMYSGGMTSASAPTGGAAPTSSTAAQLAIERGRKLYGGLNQVVKGAFGLVSNPIPRSLITRRK